MRSRNVRAGLLALAATAVATSAAAVPVHKALTARGRLDVPNHRSSHATPTPRGGGLAALTGAGLGSLVIGRGPSRSQTVGIAALACAGWADDVTGHLSARVRMLTQMTVGGLLLTSGSWDRLTGSLVTAGVVNVVNFMDGINGISGLTAAVWGINAMTLNDSEDGDLAVLGALTAGAGLGFLPHNIPTAKLFLGDVGSYALGAAMAAGILSQPSTAQRYRIAAPLFLYGVDAAQALVRRAAAAEPLAEAHREHVYQILVDRGGLTHLQVASLHAGAAALVTVSARLPLPYSVLLPFGLAGAYLTAGRMARIRPGPQSGHGQDPSSTYQPEERESP